MIPRFDTMQTTEPTLSQRAFAAALRASLEPFRRLKLERVAAPTNPNFEEWVVRDGDASLSFDRRLDGKGLHRVTIREGETIVVGARFGETQGFIEFRGARDHGVTSLTGPTLTFLIETLGSMRSQGQQPPPPPKTPIGNDWFPSVRGRRVVAVDERPDGRYAIELDSARWVGRAIRFVPDTLGVKLPRSTLTYVGEATVWHDISTGARADTLTEAALADVAFLHRHRLHPQAA